MDVVLIIFIILAFVACVGSIALVAVDMIGKIKGRKAQTSVEETSEEKDS